MLEQFGQFHPQPGKVVNVEEAAIVDVVRGDTEMRRAPMLVADQGVEMAGLCIQPAYHRIDSLLHCGVVTGKPAEFCF